MINSILKKICLYWKISRLPLKVGILLVLFHFLLLILLFILNQYLFSGIFGGQILWGLAIQLIDFPISIGYIYMLTLLNLYIPYDFYIYTLFFWVLILIFGSFQYFVVGYLIGKYLEKRTRI